MVYCVEAAERSMQRQGKLSDSTMDSTMDSTFSTTHSLSGVVNWLYRLEPWKKTTGVEMNLKLASCEAFKELRQNGEDEPVRRVRLGKPARGRTLVTFSSNYISMELLCVDCVTLR